MGAAMPWKPQREVEKPVDPIPLIAAVRYEAGFDINRLLAEVVALLRRERLKIGGVLQEAEAGGDPSCVQLNVADIRTGKCARITQERGRDARGCKLDPRGLADISHCVGDAIRAGVDLIIINKFGRAESEGYGLLSCFAEAVTAGVPVLTTVREPYLEAWGGFHGGLAADLSPAKEAVLDWCLLSCRQPEMS
jgi:nucleoside-triphosphatase THEP1